MSSLQISLLVAGAVTLLAEKRAGGSRPGRAQAGALVELGAHPGDGQPVRLLLELVRAGAPMRPAPVFPAA